MNIHIQTLYGLFREADIEGLIEIGAPNDEYDSEAKALSIALAELSSENITKENISPIISEIWRQSFNLDTPGIAQRRHAIDSLAAKIFQQYAELI